MCKSGQFLIALPRHMEQVQPGQIRPASPADRAAAFSVHIFTALGAGVALLALLEAVREHWAAMFGWLGVALIIDALDGPMARRLDVVRLQPNWSGDVLDLVVDFVTYVFVPAYAITAERPVAAACRAAAGSRDRRVSGALYFADRRMKSADNHFRGFPGLWNVAAFYLFLLHMRPALLEPCRRAADRGDVRSVSRAASGACDAAALADVDADRAVGCAR